MRTPPDEMRLRLLEASGRLDRGGVDVSIDDMAREAGIPRATMYYYFAGRDDLVAFLFAEKIETMAAAVRAAVAADASVPDRVRLLVEALFRSMAAQPALCLEMPMAMQKPEAFGATLHCAEEAVMGPIRALLEEGVADGTLRIGEIDTAMTVLQGAVWQLAMGELLSPEEFAPDRLAEAATPMLLGALGAH